MKFIVFAFIAGVAAFLGWQMLQPVCPGGTVVKSEAECQQTSGFNAAFCRKAFVAARALENKGAGYSTTFECQRHYSDCIVADHIVGYVGKAKSVCVRKEPSGEPWVDIYF